MPSRTPELPPRLAALGPADFDGRSTRSTTRAAPGRVVASDGRVYWVKSAQSGSAVNDRLAAELVAGWIASLLGIGPGVAIVDLPPLADLGWDDLVGVCFGSREVEGAFNLRNASHRATKGAVDLQRVALLVTFQTWIGHEDVQALCQPSGDVWSIDHEVYAAFRCETSVTLALTPELPGLLGSRRPAPSDYNQAIDRIRNLSAGKLSLIAPQLPYSSQGWSNRVHIDAVIRTLESRRNSLDAPMLSAW